MNDAGIRERAVLRSTMTVDAVRVWKEATTLLEKELPAKDFSTWIQDLRPRVFVDNDLTLEAPFGLYRDRIHKVFLPRIESAVSIAARGQCRVTVVVEGEDGGASRPQRGSSRSAEPRSRGRGRVGGRTFASFVVGEPNRLAYRAAEQLAAGEMGGANPLFIFGGVGLGKTHLLHAVEYELRSRGGRVLYFSGEEFTRRMVDALDSSQMARFRRDFQLADALLIDDVQCMVGKKRTQQELTQAFNLLHAAGKPVAFASDRPPGEIKTFEDGLRNRFEGGVIAELLPLDLGLRNAILRAKLAEADIQLDDEFIDRVAAVLNGSVREIEGIVANLRLALSDGAGSVEGAVLESIIAPFLRGRGPVTVESIIEVVARAFGVSREEILSRGRTRRVSLPRHVSAYLCRKLTRASSTEVGIALGGRKHTSVIRACRWVQERACDDPSLASRLAELERLLGGTAVVPVPTPEWRRSAGM